MLSRSLVPVEPPDSDVACLTGAVGRVLSCPSQGLSAWHKSGTTYSVGGNDSGAESGGEELLRGPRLRSGLVVPCTTTRRRGPAASSGSFLHGEPWEVPRCCCLFHTHRLLEQSSSRVCLPLGGHTTSPSLLQAQKPESEIGEGVWAAGRAGREGRLQAWGLGSGGPACTGRGGEEGDKAPQRLGAQAGPV